MTNEWVRVRTPKPQAQSGNLVMTGPAGSGEISSMVRFIGFRPFILVATFAFSTAVSAHVRSSMTTAATSSEKLAPADVAIQAFKKYRKIITSLTVECLSFIETGPIKGESEADVEVREKHTPKCGGDEGIAPIVANLRVKKGHVYIYDVLEDGYRLLNSKYKP